jgi:hypothetical protein
VPDVALGVDPEPVGRPWPFVLVEDAFVADFSGGEVVVPGQDLARGRVREVEGLAVRGEADGVGDREARFYERGGLGVGGEDEEGALGEVLVVCVFLGDE